MKTEPQNQTSKATNNNSTSAKATYSPRRHMRRRACPNSGLSTQDSALSARRQRSRPFQTLPEFAHLRPDQLEFIHDLLRNSTLAEVQQQLFMDLGIRLSDTTLHRYRTQLNLAHQLQVSDDTQPAVDHLRDLYAARPTQLDAAGLQIIKQRALELAASPKTSPSLFKDLHRIFTYEDRKQEKQNTLALRHTQRLELAHLREQTRLQISADRRTLQQEQLTHCTQIDLAKLQLARDRHALELRKQDHREKLAAAKAPQDSNLTEAQRKIEAILNYHPPCNADNLSASLTQTNQTTGMTETQTSQTSQTKTQTN